MRVINIIITLCAKKGVFKIFILRGGNVQKPKKKNIHHFGKNNKIYLLIYGFYLGNTDKKKSRQRNSLND